MANEVVTTKGAKPIDQFRASINNLSPALKNALPTHIPVERFVNVAITAVNLNPKLLDCNRNSLFTACMRAAQDGLLPDGRDGAIVPYGETAQWMPMYQGLIRKMRNSGEIATISAHPVYAKDHFEYILGDAERIDHKPFTGGEPGEVTGAYAIVTLKDGSIQREYVPRTDIDKARRTSRSPDSPAWKNWYSEMSRKVAIHRISKYLPMTPELASVVQMNLRSLVDPEATEESIPSLDQPLTALAPAKTVSNLDKFEQTAATSEPDTVTVVGHPGASIRGFIEAETDRDKLKAYWVTTEVQTTMSDLSEEEQEALRKLYQVRFKALAAKPAAPKDGVI